MSHLDALQRGGKAVAGSSGTGPRGASNGQPGTKTAARQSDAMQMLMQAQLFSQRQTQIKVESDPRQKIPINQGRFGHWDSNDGTEKMRRLGACDRLRASGFFRRAPPIPTL